MAITQHLDGRAVKAVNRFKASLRTAPVPGATGVSGASHLTLAANPVTAKLLDAPREAKLLVSKVLSYEIDGIDHMKRKGSVASGWDGRSSFLNFAGGTFPAGFLTLVYKTLTAAGYSVKVVRKEAPPPLGPEKPVVDRFPEEARYAYQRQTVDLLLRHRAIIAQVATGGGKSRIAKLAHSRIARRTLFLTTRGILLHQMRETFERDLGSKVGIFGDSSWSTPELFNVGMVQTFAQNLESGEPTLVERTKKLLSSFEFVILEEAHEASSTSYYKVMSQCIHAHYRLALTATPFMKDSDVANMRLHACTGPVAIKVSEKYLIDHGILATPYFKFVDVPKAEKLYASTPWVRAYQLGITDHLERNRLIVREAMTGVSAGLSVMVLVKFVEHGRTLAKMLTEGGVSCNFIRGEHDHAERSAALDALKEKRISVLIGSTILDVGVDVPAVGMIILAAGGKAEVALRQRIGRGLRAKKPPAANVAFIVDFNDTGNTHLRKHAMTRRAIIESTPGFGERILLSGGDFPWDQIKP